MVRTKQTARKAPEPTREEIEEALRQQHLARPSESRQQQAARQSGHNRKPSPTGSESDAGEEDAELSDLHSSQQSQSGSTSARSSVASSRRSSHRSASAAASRRSSDRSAASHSPAGSARSASVAHANAPAEPSSDDAEEEEEQSMYQLRIKHREALQNVEQYFLSMMSQVWSQYLHASQLNGNWPHEDVLDLRKALSSQKAQPKIVNELKLLGYEDMFDDGHLVHDTFKDITT